MMVLRAKQCKEDAVGAKENLANDHERGENQKRKPKEEQGIEKGKIRPDVKYTIPCLLYYKFKKVIV